MGKMKRLDPEGNPTERTRLGLLLRPAIDPSFVDCTETFGRIVVPLNHLSSLPTNCDVLVGEKGGG